MAEKKKQGFAAMDQTKLRELASKGGKAAHAVGKAHKFTTEEAQAAGRKGGLKHSKEHLAAIGRKGGANSRKGRRKGGVGGQ